MYFSVTKGGKANNSEQSSSPSKSPQQGVQRHNIKLEELYPYKVLQAGEYLWPGWPKVPATQGSKVKWATLSSISEALHIPYAILNNRLDILFYFNEHFTEKQPIAPGKEILVPIETSIQAPVQSRSLIMKDVETYNIELKMMRLSSYPIFWVYYCTADADVLGKLVLTPTELVFEPLNPNFRGYYDYRGTPC